MNAHAEVVCKLMSSSSDPVMDKVEITYNDSFPPEERREFTLIRQLIDNAPRFKAYQLLRNGVYVGFLTSWQFADYIYAEHFAIDETARNGGIGAAAMKQFMAICTTPIVLEVEMPTEELSKRRIGFYQRLGFVLDDHSYQQPPYRPGEPWLEMRLMTYGEIDLDKDIEQVKTTLHQYVYGI
ncbi:MAG: GNAT family N-acetyltransferase [Tannerellaceae bacterium]